jgi:glycosyltransferase involved in cell wall biosynthesis
MNPFTGGCHYTHGCERYKSNCSNCPQLINDYDDFPSKIINIKQLLWDKRVVVVTPSKWLANCARESVVFRDAEIVVIPNSVDTNIFHPTDKLLARSKFSLPVGKKILLFSCQTHEEKRKGFAELVKVISFLPGDKDDYHILGFGNSTREIEKLGISHTFLGHINDPSILALGYCAADVTILPSLEDNLPNIILESVSCGTPVVAFDAGGVGDAVINGLTGYLVPLYDCKLMAHMIKKCSEENFTNKCREYALKHFRLEVQANRYSMLFQRLLSNKTHRSIAPPISQIYEEHSNPIKELIS